MTYRLEDLYEVTFLLLNRLNIQPSEADKLTVPEYRTYIKLYRESQDKERKALDDLKNAKKSSAPRPILRRHR